MSKKWILVASVAAFLCLWQNAAFAGHDHGHGDEEHGQGHGHAYGHKKHDGDEHHRHYRDHDRELHEWYRTQAMLSAKLGKRSPSREAACSNVLGGSM